ncbi:MAG: hypothetical protein M3R43_00425 [Acidobacteriota bacterium]|nr:hypothetical protein [Acidobacteriota bacterium]
MSIVVHIPLSELPDSQILRDRIRSAEEIVLETADESFRFTREHKGPGRTAAEMLELLGTRGDIEIDGEWSSDMVAIMRENRAHDRDPWAE